MKKKMFFSNKIRNLNKIIIYIITNKVVFLNNITFIY